jgi:hypothetical protein
MFRFFITLLFTLLYISFLQSEESRLPSEKYTRNMLNIPMSKMKFVFYETQGTIEHIFVDEEKAANDFVIQYGLVSERDVTLFLDIQFANNDDNKDYSNSQKEVEVFDSTGDQGNVLLPRFNITEEFLVKHFGNQVLKTNRKTLVGTIIFPNIVVAGADNLRVAELPESKNRGFQAVLPSNINDEPYSNYDRVYDRVSMLKYMYLNKNKSYIGLMEIYDRRNGAITFLAIEGDRAAFMQQYNISELRPGYAK